MHATLPLLAATDFPPIRRRSLDPDLKSIKDLGSQLSSPWKPKWIAQLDEQTLRFMSDRTRNRYNAQRGRLELSKIFDWYGEDFRLGHRGIASLPAFAARHADQLADASAGRERIRAASVDIAFFDYDWALNDAQ